MPGRDWELIKAIFDQARNVPENELDTLLASLCAGDPDMAAFVRSLVANDHDATEAALPYRERVFSEGALVAGRLRVVRFIDSGAMGEVYEAFDERLRIRVALKTVRLEMAPAGDVLGRFEREIRMAREVSHPNLCRVFDFVDHQESVLGSQPVSIPCYTMELIEGESLASFLESARPLSCESALPLIRQIASGLDALHARGIVHRDLKPSNIMVTSGANNEMRAVLMDFGLAKLLNPDDDLFQTRMDVRVGAPYFLAPEILRDALPSVASDLYAFGLIADEMVTRTRAFQAQSLQALYFAKIWEAPVPPGERADKLPANWQRAILQCTAPSPENRYKRAAAFVAALESDEPPSAEDLHARQLPAWRSKRLGRILAPVVRRPFMAGGASLAAFSGALLLAGLFGEGGQASVQVYEVRNGTGDESLNYLCNGTANELIRRLTQVKGARVLRMRTVQGRHPPPKSAGFSIEGILTGSSRRIRLSVLLTDNRTGQVFDAGGFEGKPADSLPMENEVAAITASNIEKRLGAARAGGGILESSMFPLLSRFAFWHTAWDQAVKGPTTSGPAFDLYMRGRQLLDEYTQASIEASIPYLSRSIVEDSSFALAYATLAEAQLNLMTFVRTPQQESLLAAGRSADTALTLDPFLPEAQAAKAYVLQAEWDWKGAETHFLKALSLKPGYAAARRRYAGLLLQFGRIDEALTLARRAFSEDPYDRGSIPGIGLYYYLAGNYAEAVRFLESQIGDSDMQAARHNLGDALAEAAVHAPAAERAALFERALSQAQRVVSIERRRVGEGEPTPMGDEMFAHYYTMMENRVAAEPYWQKCLAEMNRGESSPAIVAWIYALRGEREQALDLLEQALVLRDRRLMYVKLFPALNSLHRDSRFESIVSRMGLQ